MTNINGIWWRFNHIVESLCYLQFTYHERKCINRHNLTAHNWQKWKSRFLTCPCYKMYKIEAVGLKSSNYTLKNTIFVNMWNLGLFRKKLIFCKYMLNWRSNLNILLHICDTYYYNYLQHNTFRFYLIDFQLNIDFPSQFCVSYQKIT